MKLKKIYLLLFLIFFITKLSAEPFSIRGLSVKMSNEQIIAYLVKNGLKCAIPELDATQKKLGITPNTYCGMKDFPDSFEYTYAIMGNYDSVVEFSNNGILIKCSFTETCDFSSKEIAQALINQGIVKNFEPRESRSGWYYFSRGKDGDEIHVYDSKEITLVKGAYGKGKPKLK